ncbi:MAG: hypothetical protein HPY69_11255 [Armatimonadetes bacterium]|nr:hypothetical protein [Armatimonadota bacterium]
MKSSRRPLWIIGIDGLEPRLLSSWSAAGELPTLASLAARGVTGRLLSTPNQMTSSAWVTMATGANPGAHGVYNFQERVPGEYRLRLPTANDRRLAAFWELASGAGLSVTTARVPMSYPVRPVNGIQVADWLAPSPHAPGFVYPETLRRGLLRRFPGRYWLEPVDLTRAAPQKALRGVLESVDHTFRLFRYLLDQRPADLFFGVVREADVAGHLFWDFHTGAREAPAPHRKTMAEALLTVYRRIDRALGELLGAMPAEANLLIVSDHGMGATPLAPRCVGPLLEATGLMARKPGNAASGKRPLARLRSQVSAVLPWALRRRLRPLGPDDWAVGFTDSHLATIDFGRSRAFSFLSLTTGEIWLNLVGRDPQGTVRPAEREQLELDIQELFVASEDAETGQPLVRNAWRRQDLFHGPYQDILADLHIEFDLEARPRAVRSRFRQRDIVVDLPPAGPAGGMHRPYGAFLASGPSIRHREKPVAGTLMDLAPTFLSLLDLPVPDACEGRVLGEILAPRGDGIQGPRQRGAGLTAARYTREELATIEQRLSRLGYL